MTVADPGSALLARIDPLALVGNAAGWVDADAVADLRADACGHGAASCATVLALVGLRRAVVDPQEAEAVRRTGVTVVDTPPNVVPEALFGLTGVGQPVMTLVSEVLSVKDLLAGEGVSYGYRHRARVDTRIALVAGGYAQGVVRSLGGDAEVVIDGGRHPIIGRVAMDVCVVDIGDADIDRGARAVFFGDPADGAPSIDTWAQATGMRATELVTAVGAKVRRVDL